MSSVSVQQLPGPCEHAVEIVEHKGIGHPDTICDALAEEVSKHLCRFYLDRFGAILHHNVDKALLWGGASRPAFGGGEVVAPIEIFLAGRVTIEAKGVAVPAEEIAREASLAWLRAHVHALDPGRHVKIHCLFRPGAADLVELFLRQASTGVFLANDTSCGSGYAPLSMLERTVLAVADELARAASEGREAGEDVKVMGLRDGAQVKLTAACAMVDRWIPSLSAYVERRRALEARISDAAARVSGGVTELALNAADDLASGSVYLTVTGTSAEAGDDGQVGRGNRVNGLITPYRPMTLEAAAGKNPVSHVGKLYNVAAHRIAAELVREIPDISDAEVHLVSRIGRPIHEPQAIDVRVRPRPLVALADVAPRAREIVAAHVAEIGSLWRELVRGGVRLF
jgi:S-adenosylmethionine synthetase